MYKLLLLLLIIILSFIIGIYYNKISFDSISNLVNGPCLSHCYNNNNLWIFGLIFLISIIIIIISFNIFN